VAAGRRLAARLVDLESVRPVVLGLPRGGVPVAAEIATALHAPLDVLLVRKIGAPGHPELAIGAMAEDDTIVMNDDVVRATRARPAEVDAAIERARAELDAQAARWQGSRRPVNIADRTVVVVDDGVATGATLRAALALCRLRGAASVVAAAPVAAPDSWGAVAAEADRAECLLTPWPFDAVGRWYDRFDQTSDDEVRALLAAARPD
jgi:putative phosphoribosyl transferase